MAKDKYAVSTGIYCFFSLKPKEGGGGDQGNIFAGFKCTDIDKTPNVRTMKEVMHQLSSGGWATFIPLGKKTPGELTVKGYFEFAAGTPHGPDPLGFVSEIEDGAEGEVSLGIVQGDGNSATIFFKCDANVASDGGFSAPLNEVITTETKFTLSGKPLCGTANVTGSITIP